MLLWTSLSFLRRFSALISLERKVLDWTSLILVSDWSESHSDTSNSLITIPLKKFINEGSIINIKNTIFLILSYFWPDFSNYVTAPIYLQYWYFNWTKCERSRTFAYFWASVHSKIYFEVIKFHFQLYFFFHENFK